MHSFRFLVHNVDEHHQAEPVGLFNKSPQLIWSAEPAAGMQERTQRNCLQAVCRSWYYLGFIEGLGLISGTGSA